MKVLFDHPLPFVLAHGGFQIQIEQTKMALERCGVEVEHLRWWDDRQTADIIHYFGRPSVGYIDFAHAKGMKVVTEELLSGLGSRSAQARFFQKTFMRAAETIVPETFRSRLGWDTYRKADAFIANTAWEAYLMRSMFEAKAENVYVIPNGVEDIFFPSVDEIDLPRLDYLVCTAAIHPRKRVLELARAAVKANVPVWIVGRPYSEAETYYQQFLQVQRSHPGLIRYEGGIADRSLLARIYRQARGFVLLSTMETLSLSSFEAAASLCPLLLSDLPWARTTFGDTAKYASRMEPSDLAKILRDFYEKCPLTKAAFTPLKWDEVGELFKAVYVKVLS